MRNRNRKILSLILTASMVFATYSYPVLGEEITEEIPVINEEAADTSGVETDSYDDSYVNVDSGSAGEVEEDFGLDSLEEIDYVDNVGVDAVLAHSVIVKSDDIYDETGNSLAGENNIFYFHERGVLELKDVQIDVSSIVSSSPIPGIDFTDSSLTKSDYYITITGKNSVNAKGDDHAIMPGGKTITISGSGILELVGSGSCGALGEYGTYKTSLPVMAGDKEDGSDAVATTIDDAIGKKYVKIGDGSAEEKKEDTPAPISYNIIKEADLKEIGGHKVSVNYTTNLKFDGRAKYEASGCSKSDKTASTTKDPCLKIEVLVDGKPLPKDMLTFKIKNNRYVYNKVKGSTVSGSTIEIKVNNKNEYGKEFAKAMKEFFKANGDALTFYILPDDLNETDFDLSGAKSKSKLEGTTVKKVGKVIKEYRYENVSKSKKRTLKWDKKNNDLTRDYTAKVSENGMLVLTGQGNYQGEVVIPVS